MFEIGNTLRESRLRRGLDIADCEAATKIRAKYLRALEEEQFDVLPGPTYIKGFLRTYSEHLELDGRLVVDEYEARFTKRSEHAVEDPARRRARRRRNREGRVLAVAAGLVMAIALAVWVGFADDPQPVPEPPAGQITTVFTALGPRATYLEVRRGGPEGAEILPTGDLRAGTSREVAAVAPIWVRVGDGAGLRLTVDGAPVTPPPGASEFRILEGGELQPSVPG